MKQRSALLREPYGSGRTLQLSEYCGAFCLQDLSLYINEVKRDCETMEQIDGLEKRYGL